MIDIAAITSMSMMPRISGDVSRSEARMESGNAISKMSVETARETQIILMRRE
jgi:hypothetical protein